MGIGKRIIHLARSNLTDFRTAFDRDHLRDLLTSGAGSNDIDDRDSEHEDIDIDSVGTKAGRRVRQVRDAAEIAWERAYETAKARAGVRGDPLSDPVAERRRWYKTLEVPVGSDIKTVRRAYRRALLQYHPDKFANHPDKQKTATEITRRLTEAYNGLTEYLGG